MPIQVMPDRKWIHRSRNRKPDSFISAIEPSLERTAVQAVPSLVVLVQFVGVVLREQRDVLVLVPRPSAKPRHREILRIIPPQNSATGVLLMVVVGRDYSKAFFVSTRFSGRRRLSTRVRTVARPVTPRWEALDGPVALPD